MKPKTIQVAVYASGVMFLAIGLFQITGNAGYSLVAVGIGMIAEAIL